MVHMWLQIEDVNVVMVYIGAIRSGGMHRMPWLQVHFRHDMVWRVIPGILLPDTSMTTTEGTMGDDMVKEFDVSAFKVSETDIRIENQRIENCRITGIHHNSFVFHNCQFDNVIFDSVYKGNKGQCVNIEECEFKNCLFSDKFVSFGGFSVLLLAFNNLFLKCRFENVVYHGYLEQSEVQENKLVNCTFKGSVILGDLTLGGIELSGGSIEKCYYEGNSIFENSIVDVAIEDVVMRGSLHYNSFKNVTFKNVTVVGVDSRNEFIDCTECYKFIHEMS